MVAENADCQEKANRRAGDHRGMMNPMRQSFYSWPATCTGLDVKLHDVKGSDRLGQNNRQKESIHFLV